jgi:hypothetical protein
VLDEPSIPLRPATRYEEREKISPFQMLRTGPRPGGIPICKNDVVLSRAKRQAWFEDQMTKKDDREMYVREKTLHRRAMTSRAFHSALRDRTAEMAGRCGQEWVNIPAKRAESARRASVLEEERKLEMTPEEERLMSELAAYDEKIYRESHGKEKRSTEDIEAVLEETIKKKRSRAGSEID